jgi:hypothetical protein
VVCTKLQLLFDLIMNAIHQFEADQPMLQLCLEPTAGTAQGSARHDQGPKALCHKQLVSRVYRADALQTPAIALQAPGDRIPRCIALRTATLKL